MSTATVLMHVPREGCQRIGDHLRRRGVTVQERALFSGDAVPSAIPAGDLLVVMGGPMGVGDLGDPNYPFLQAEIALLRRCLADQAPVLGVCLGAQLLAHAAGARVFPNHASGNLSARVREVGWFPLDFHGDFQRDPVLRGLPTQAVQLHWHGDTFDLPAGAVGFASTSACRNQAFRLGYRQFGLQFHPECDAATIAEWCDEDAAFAELAHGPGTPARIQAEIPRWFGEYVTVGDRLIANLLDQMLA
ncbi:amidotransferase [Planctomycetota bacterium]|nr:amidotransferase [Planctomycetota bacterium]